MIRTHPRESCTAPKPMRDTPSESVPRCRACICGGVSLSSAIGHIRPRRPTQDPPQGIGVALLCLLPPCRCLQVLHSARELSCRWPIHLAQMAKTAYVFGHSLARNGQNNLETFAISTTRGQFRTTHDAYDTSGQPALEHRISGAWPTRCTWPICLSSELSDGQSIDQGNTTTYNHRSGPYDPQTQTYVHAPPQRDTNPLDDGETARRGDRGGGRTKECGQAQGRVARFPE